MKNKIRTYFKKYNELVDHVVWYKSGWNLPAPKNIKNAILKKNGAQNSTWVETGTYFGDTTEFLSKISDAVISLEPELDLYRNAKKRFSRHPNVEIINGTSEAVFRTVIEKLTGNVSFWLDGHYSEGVTYKGSKNTPILEELEAISQLVHQFKMVSIFVDDFRLFGAGISIHESELGYPSKDEIVNWCRRNNFNWSIEYDIFIAKNY